jgi:hypothetical protein
LAIVTLENLCFFDLLAGTKIKREEKKERKKERKKILSFL